MAGLWFALLFFSNILWMVVWLAAHNDVEIAKKDLWALRMRIVGIKQGEVEKYTHWLTTHDPRNYMEYHHSRNLQLDKTRGGDTREG